MWWRNGTHLSVSGGGVEINVCQTEDGKNEI